MNNKKFWVKLSAILSTTIASSKSPAIDLQSKPKNADKTDFNSISSPYKGKPGKSSLIGEISNTDYPLVLSSNGKVTPLIKGLQAFELSFLHSITDSIQLGILVPGEKPTGMIGSYNEGKSYLTNILIEPKIYFSNNMALIPLYYIPNSGQNVQTSINGNAVSVPTSSENGAYGAKLSMGILGDKNTDDTLVAVQIGAIIAPESKFREIDQTLRYQFGAGVNHKLSGNLKLLFEAYGEKTSSNAPLEALAMIEYSNDNYMLRIGGGSGDLKGSGSNTSRVLANFAYYFGDESVATPRKYNLEGEANKEKVDALRKRMQENEIRDQNYNKPVDQLNQEQDEIENQEKPQFDTESRSSKIFPGELVCDNSEFSQIYSRSIAAVTDAGEVGEGSIKDPEVKEILLASTDKVLVRKIKYYSKNIDSAIKKLNENLIKLEKAKKTNNVENLEKLTVEINWGIRVFYKNKYELDKFVSFANAKTQKHFVELDLKNSAIVEKAQVATNFEPKIQDVNFTVGSQFKVNVKTSLMMRTEPKIDINNIIGKLLANDIVQAFSEKITNGYVQVNILESENKAKSLGPVYVHGNFLKKIESQDSKKENKKEVPDIRLSEKNLTPPFAESIENSNLNSDVLTLANSQKGESLENQNTISQTKDLEKADTVKVDIPEEKTKDLTPAFASEIKVDENINEILSEAKNAQGLSKNNEFFSLTKDINDKPETVKIRIEEEKERSQIDPVVLIKQVYKNEILVSKTILENEKAAEHVEEKEAPQQDERVVAKQMFKNEIEKSKEILSKEHYEDIELVKKDLNPPFAKNINSENDKFEEVLQNAKNAKGESQTQHIENKLVDISEEKETIKIKNEILKPKNLTPAFADSLQKKTNEDEVLAAARDNKGLSQVNENISLKTINIDNPLETVKVDIKEAPPKDLTPNFAESLKGSDSTMEILSQAKISKPNEKLVVSDLKTVEIPNSLESVKIDYKDQDFEEKTEKIVKNGDKVEQDILKKPEIYDHDFDSKFGNSFVFEKNENEKNYIGWTKDSPDPEILVSEVEETTSVKEVDFKYENKEASRESAGTKLPKKLPAKIVDKNADAKKQKEISDHLTKVMLVENPVEVENSKSEEILIEVVNKDEQQQPVKIEKTDPVVVESSITKESKNSLELVDKKEEVLIQQSKEIKESKEDSKLILVDSESKKENINPELNLEKKEEQKQVVEIKTVDKEPSKLVIVEEKEDLSLKEAEVLKLKIQEEMKSIDDYIDKKMNESGKKQDSAPVVIEKKSTEIKVLPEKNQTSEDLFLKNLREKELKEQQQRNNLPLQEQDGIEEQNGPSFGGINE